MATQNAVYNENMVSYEEMFMQFISDVTREMNEIMVKVKRNDNKGIGDNLARINAALYSIMDAKSELTNNQEI